MNGLLGPVTANRNLLAQAVNSRNKPPLELKQNTPQGLLDAAAMATSPFPIAGDVVGLLADGHRFATQPETRTPLNFGLAALGLLPFIPAPNAMKKAGKLTERERQLFDARADRVKNFDEEYRFTNLQNLVPKEYIPPQFGQELVTVYRGVPSTSTSKGIFPGDWVSLDKKYAMQHGTSESGKSVVVEMKVPASDIGWAGTDMNEFFYVPKNKSK